MIITDIIQAIAKSIAPLGNAENVYIDKLEQNMECPCFFIRLLNIRDTTEIDYGSKSVLFFEIHYVVADGKFDVLESYAVGEQLVEALRTLEVNENLKLFGKRIEYEMHDEVLYFFVSYDCYLLDIDIDAYMLKLTENGVVTVDNEKEEGDVEDGREENNSN